jgi:hypothetical protein
MQKAIDRVLLMAVAITYDTIVFVLKRLRHLPTGHA